MNEDYTPNCCQGQLAKGNGYWFVHNLADNNIAVYFGILSSTINKLDVLTRTSQDFLKTYMFSISDSDGKTKTVPVYSKSQIYQSHDQILDYCRMNKITILYSASAIKRLVETHPLDSVVVK